MSESGEINEVRLYDPARRPVEWTDLMRPGQFAVFLSDVRGGGPVRRDGRSAASSPASCFVFDSFHSAEAFCRATVDGAANVRCDVYDHRGKAGDALLTVVNPRHERRLPSRRKIRAMMTLGIAMIPPSPLLFWWDFRNGLTLIWPTLLAINLLVFGLRIVHWAYMELEGMRAREKRAAEVGG